MIYVDELRQYGKARWCHMMTDSDLSELHLFASSIGLKRTWFQEKSHPHYDLRAAKRDEALARGATGVSSKELIERCVWRDGHVNRTASTG